MMITYAMTAKANINQSCWTFPTTNIIIDELTKETVMVAYNLNPVLTEPLFFKSRNPPPRMFGFHFYNPSPHSQA